MILRTPHYYKNFKCIASDCKDNCCIGGWEIDIDEETALYYKNLTGEFGDRLRASIDFTDEYCFKLKDGRCPFLDDHNLCEIYQHLGEDKMGVVCTQFPRFSEYFGTIKETGIGLACEEAERIIFSDRDSFSLDTTEINEECVEDSEFDATLAESLFKYRDKIMQLLDCNSNTLDYAGCNLDCLSFTECLQVILHSASHLQQLINENDYSAIEEYVENLELVKYSLPSVSDSAININAGVYRILCAYSGLEVLTEDWQIALDEVFSKLHPECDCDDDDLNDVSCSEYAILSTEFEEYIKKNNREYEYYNLAKYYVFRYFMKASYDHDIYGKALLTVANWIVIRDMDIMRWINNNRQFSFEDRIDTVHIFSREVEYSEDNLWELNEEFMFDEIFEYDSMVKLVDSL